MRKTKIEPGCNEIGIIYDGEAETPSVVGMLHATTDSALGIRIPYVATSLFEEGAGRQQFSTINEWFSTEQFPEHLSFDAGDLKVQLFGCRFRSKKEFITGTGTSVATMTPQIAVVSPQSGHLTEPLRLREMTSSIDALLQWSGIRTTSSEYERNQDGRLSSFTIRATTTEPISWQSGDAQLAIHSHWKGSAGPKISPDALLSTDSTGIESSTWLTSTFEEPRTVQEHLTKQRELVALLVLVYGAPIRFREHLTSDERFGTRSHLVYVHTWREHHHELGSIRPFKFPIFRMTDIGVKGLTLWAGKDRRWDRAVNPLLGLLQRDTYVVEDIAIAAMISIEAAGQLIDQAHGENVTYNSRGKPILATQAYRCLSYLPLDWEKMPFDPVRLAKAMANNYNDLKHFDRGEFPEPEVTYALGKFALAVARLVSLKVASTEAVDEYLKDSWPRDIERAVELLKDLNIDNRGKASFTDEENEK